MPTEEILDPRKPDPASQTPEVLDRDDDWESRLTPRQAAFVRYYVIHNNATRAAVQAGYSAPTADAAAGRLLSDVRIKDAVARARAVRDERLNIKADCVIEEINILAVSDISHYQIDEDGHIVPAPGAPPGVMRAVKSFKRKKTIREDQDGNVTITYEVELRLWDKPGSLKLLGKHTGVRACFDRVELTGLDGGPIEVAAAKLAELPPEQLGKKMRELTAHVSEDEEGAA